MGLHVEREGSGPPLVLVHGVTQTGRSWARVAAALARDHEVLRPDAPGHGGSSDIEADLPSGGDLLVESVGGPATYVGYSMGARLCLHAALQHPDSVRGLVLIGGTAGIDDADERAARRSSDEALAARLETDGLEAFIDTWLAQPLFERLPADAADRADRLRNTVTGLRSSLVLAGTGTQVPAWDRLGALTMPVLALAGAEDARFTALAERLAAAVGPNAAAAVVPDAGHAAHLEQPEAFLAILRPWLAAHSQ
jgi:2-succinyl-6-hydroxy-2,4-cyclohexadiene-1-carboxylate synthase